MKINLTPVSYEDSRKVVLFFGIVSYALAISDYVTGHVPSRNGLWGWLYSHIYDWFGPLGMPLWWTLVGTVLITLYFTKRRK